MKYEKLVRDRIPDLIASDGRTADYRTATIAERDSFLLRKLFEECREVIDAVRSGDPTQLREELADVLEAIEGIGQVHGIDEVLVPLVEEDCSLVRLPERLVPVEHFESSPLGNNPEGSGGDPTHVHQFMRPPAPRIHDSPAGPGEKPLPYERLDGRTRIRKRSRCRPAWS